ncbi:hypothetical protein D8S78_18325 [Natrialba swarupiae]|nr:hypothetical protein [Natrialba swarupiae]
MLAENFDADVEESNDASAAGSRTDDSGLELSLRTLPLVPIGFVAMALSPFARGVSRFAAWESTLPPETRRVLHGGYRIGRFWTFAALFVALAVLTLYAELSLYARVLGTSPGRRSSGDDRRRHRAGILRPVARSLDGCRGVRGTPSRLAVARNAETLTSLM